MRQRLTPILMVVLLCVSALVFFYRVVFFHRSFLPGLVVAQGVTGSPPMAKNPIVIKDYPYLDAEGAAYVDAPSTMFASSLYHQWRLPLWNPHVAMGAPFLADLQSAHFYPLKIPLFIHPTPFMWDLFFVIRIVFGGIFTYCFCRMWNISRAGSLAASFIFMYCGNAVLYIHMNRLSAEVMLPFVLVFTERLARSVTLRNAVLLALVFGVMQLGGAGPQSAFALTLFATAYFLFRATTAASSRKGVGAALGYYALAGLVGLLISLPTIVPFIEFVRLSFHTHHDTGLVSVPPTESILFFVPFFLGEHSFVITYIGVIAPTLALTALMAGRDRKLIYFLWGFIVFYLARTFGVPGTNWIESLPLFKQTFFPKYFHPPFIFSLAVCAAVGFDFALMGQERRWSRLWALAPVSIFLVAFYRTYRGPIGQMGKTSQVATQLGLSFLIIFVLALILALCRSERIQYRIRASLLCLAVFGEMFFYTLPLDYPRRANPFDQAPYIRFLGQDHASFRVFSLQGVLPPNYSMAFGLSDIGANNGIFISQYIELMRAAINPVSGYGIPANAGTPNIISPLLNLFNVKYLISRSYLSLPPSRFRLVYDNEVKIYENAECMPRAFVIYQWEEIKDGAETLRRMISGAFDMRESVFVEEQPLDGGKPNGKTATTSTPAPEIVRYAANEVVIKASVTRNSLLVLTDSFYPGWKATVDGQRTRIIRADYLFRAVYLTPGEHTVRFVYRPMSFWLSLIISAVTAIGIVGLLLKRKSS
ncbi:YfhO family protein [Candidatus Poribacteria bacterium]|nr:YfhO family protein [Candidatus Poribacteria bacterium]